VKLTWILSPVRMIPLPGRTSPVHVRVKGVSVPAAAAAMGLMMPAATAKIAMATDEYILRWL
jgi:hypothetical protein